MSKLLLTVEDSFLLTRIGLIVLPDVPFEIIGDKKIKSGQPISVRLVHKDGSEEETEAALFWAHFNPGGYRLNCVFPNATKEQVPIGTEIWLLEEDAP